MIDEESTNLSETLKAIDKAIAGYELDIKRGEQLGRLLKTPDFQDLFMTGYIDTESKKLFKILTDPSGASPLPPEEITRKLDAISYFTGFVGNEEYLGTIKTDALNAERYIERERAYRKEVTAKAGLEEG